MKNTKKDVMVGEKPLCIFYYVKMRKRIIIRIVGYLGKAYIIDKVM